MYVCMSLLGYCQCFITDRWVCQGTANNFREGVWPCKWYFLYKGLFIIICISNMRKIVFFGKGQQNVLMSVVSSGL